MVSGLLFDIQHYAIHDGPGIRTLVFFKGCPLRCRWCCNPEGQRQVVELRHRFGRCQACATCVTTCPHGALATPDGRLSIERGSCATCVGHPCVEACPHDALATAGFTMTLDELMERVSLDAAFYRNSGGGVSFSGGEPFSQAPFLLAALERCAQRGFHTVIETCGQAARGDLLAAGQLAGLFLFDLKVADGEEHRRLTGCDNELVLENFRQLAAAFPDKVVPRIPLIPGCTDGEENLARLTALVEEAFRGHPTPAITYQPYHELGAAKLGELGHVRA